MAFIEATKEGTVYAPGWFLAHEECVRKTREIDALDARVKTVNGGKYMQMGTIYPANDATAEGIVYEDVDVTAGNMPGSVVLSGVVYENRLPEAEDTYEAATVPDGGNPKELGLYEQSGSAGSYVYTLTEDTTVDVSKTYYERTGAEIPAAAKTALEGKGFTFVTEPTVTRP